MWRTLVYPQLQVHCRTGSLESYLLLHSQPFFVHCRTGSLESNAQLVSIVACVHCRTGSLEIQSN